MSASANDFAKSEHAKDKGVLWTEITEGAASRTLQSTPGPEQQDHNFATGTREMRSFTEIIGMEAYSMRRDAYLNQNMFILLLLAASLFVGKGAANTCGWDLEFKLDPIDLQSPQHRRPLSPQSIDVEEWDVGDLKELHDRRLWKIDS